MISAEGLFHLVLATILAYGLAVAIFPLLRIVGSARRAVAFAFCLIILMGPLLIPAEKIRLRALAAFLFTDLGFKLIDYTRKSHNPHFVPGDFGEYCRFLIPLPTLMIVFRQWRRSLDPIPEGSSNVRTIAIGAALFGLAVCLMKSICYLPMVRTHFAVEHVADLLIFVLAIESLSQALCGIERACGYNTTPIIQFAFLSRTVGEFWQRYNTRMHQWLTYNVFAATGGRRSPALGVWMTFLISGIQHEIAFGIATSRFDGCQFAFFTLQAPAVLVSQRLESLLVRYGNAGKVMMHALTIAWFAVTSPLFFRGVNRVFPFYCSGEFI